MRKINLNEAKEMPLTLIYWLRALGILLQFKLHLRFCAFTKLYLKIKGNKKAANRPLLREKEVR